MDEMKLNISTKLLKGIIAKIVTKIIRDKLGYGINLTINELNAEMIDGEVHLHVNVDGNMSKEEFGKLISSL